MNFSTLLNKTSTLLGIKELKPSDTATIYLSFDAVIVAIEAAEDHVLLISKLAVTPKENQESIYSFLLKATNFGALDAYVGLDALQDALTFVTKEYFAMTDEHIFARRLEKHVQHVEVLQQIIEDLQKTTAYEKINEQKFASLMKV